MHSGRRRQPSDAGRRDALLAALAEEDAPGTPDRLLSVDEASELLGIGRTRLYHELQAGRVRSVRSGRRRLVSSSALSEFGERDDAA